MAPQRTEAERTPIYSLVADVLAVALVFAVIGGSTLGLSRYTDARDHRNAVQAQARTLADTIAAEVVAHGPAAAKGVAGEAASVHVVTSGGTDEFGISRGSEVALALIADARARPSDEAALTQQLIDRSAELEDYLDKGQPIPDSRRFGAADLGGVVLFAAHAPMIAADGSYQGLVRVVLRAGRPASSVPTSLFLLCFAFALVGLGGSLLGRARRWVLGLAPGLAVLVLLGGEASALQLWSALVAAGLGVWLIPGIASVFRGVREQPGTYLYIAPAMVAMILLVFVPFSMGIAISFFRGGDFSGFENFREIMVPDETMHPTFYWTLGVTVVWTLLNVILHVSIGVALALVLNRSNLRFKGAYRMLLIVPWAVPNYITALIWKSMFNPQYGAMNALLDVVGIEPISWLGPGSGFMSNFLANLTTNTWLGFPFMMVVTLGALQSIPRDLYEAAEIDGASRWQMFRKVTLPLLKPALIPAIILGVIWTFNMFNVIYLVSGGAPENETNILITEAYHAFKVLNRFGLAAAYSILIFVILLVYGWMQNRVTKATEGAFE